MSRRTAVEVPRSELFAQMAAAPDGTHVQLELYDGFVKPCAVAHDGKVWLSVSRGFSLTMTRAMAQRLSAMLANAALSPLSKPPRKASP